MKKTFFGMMFTAVLATGFAGPAAAQEPVAAEAAVVLDTSESTNAANDGVGASFTPLDDHGWD